MKKARAHTKYYTKDGKLIPGATTVINLLAKPQLIPWGNRLGLKNIEYYPHMQERAGIGTLSHKMISDHLLEEETNTSDYTQNQIEEARNSFQSFLSWEEQHALVPSLIEQPQISEKHKFGGTPDFLGLVDGVATLLDFKTSAGVYEGMLIQGGVYRHLLEENGYKVSTIKILSVPTSKGTSYTETQVENHDIAFKIFLGLLEIYYLKKELK